MRLVFNPYSNRSLGLKKVIEELRGRGINCIELLTRGSRYPWPNEIGDTIINWGVPKQFLYPYSLNYHSYNATNKLKTLQLLSSINPLQFTTSKQIAQRDYMPLCYCRTKLCSNSGKGIIIATTPEEVVDAPLYTKGIQGSIKEYRVHVFQGRVIDVVQKRKLRSERLEERGITHNPLIRNHENGYIFSREGIDVPPVVKDMAITSLTLCSLDFGAIDIAWNGEDAYVFEINSAPGVEGTAVMRYCDAFISLLSV